jgi:hypothetical protein
MKIALKKRQIVPLGDLATGVCGGVKGCADPVYACSTQPTRRWALPLVPDFIPRVIPRADPLEGRPPCRP